MRIVLKKNFFTDKEKLFFESEDIKVSIFKFETGVEAVRLQNDLGHIIVLPFKGQMIWEAVFNGRELNMYRENKTEPKKHGTFFLDAAYGVFYFHCGALRMGSPSEDDNHPLHGELPYADYEEAELLVGNDERGRYTGITGTFTYNRGFGPCYAAHPLTKIYSKSSLLNISIEIENISNYPMELMYMAHINFRPTENARIVQSNPWTPEAMPLCEYNPRHFILPDGYDALAEKLKQHPKLTEVFKPGVMYDPEVTFYLNAPAVDADGYAHIMQILPDGTADFLKYKPSELNHAMRWISKTADQQGLSLAFPATCTNEGYNIEKKNGRVKEIAPKSSFRTSFTTGCLDKEDAVKEEALIYNLDNKEN
jgi:hypothetical protein